MSCEPSRTWGQGGLDLSLSLSLLVKRFSSPLNFFLCVLERMEEKKQSFLYKPPKRLIGPMALMGPFKAHLISDSTRLTNWFWFIISIHTLTNRVRFPCHGCRGSISCRIVSKRVNLFMARILNGSTRLRHELV